MNLSIPDSENNLRSLQMGCYGIGVSRIIAAAIEQNHDSNGIIWPKSISPFDAVIVEIDGNKNDVIRQYSSTLYENLLDKGHDIILDDRDAKLGNKLNDWELIGIPNFIIVGKSESNQNNVTFKRRGESDKSILSMDDIDEILCA